MTVTFTFPQLTPEVFARFSQEVVANGGTANGNTIALGRADLTGNGTYDPASQTLTVSVSGFIVPSDAVHDGLLGQLKDLGYIPPQ